VHYSGRPYFKQVPLNNEQNPKFHFGKPSDVCGDSLLASTVLRRFAKPALTNYEYFFKQKQ